VKNKITIRSRQFFSQRSSTVISEIFIFAYLDVLLSVSLFGPRKKRENKKLTFIGFSWQHNANHITFYVVYAYCSLGMDRGAVRDGRGEGGS